MELVAVVLMATLAATTVVAMPHQEPAPPPLDSMPPLVSVPTMEYLCQGTSSNPSNVLRLPKWVYSTTHPSNAACAIITMIHKSCIPLLQTWSFVLAHRIKLLQFRCDEYQSAESSIATAPSSSPRRKE